MCNATHFFRADCRDFIYKHGCVIVSNECEYNISNPWHGSVPCLAALAACHAASVPRLVRDDFKSTSLRAGPLPLQSVASLACQWATC